MGKKGSGEKKAAKTRKNRGRKFIFFGKKIQTVNKPQNAFLDRHDSERQWPIVLKDLVNSGQSDLAMFCR